MTAGPGQCVKRVTGKCGPGADEIDGIKETINKIIGDKRMNEAELEKIKIKAITLLKT